MLYNLSASALGDTLPELLTCLLEWIEGQDHPQKSLQQIAALLTRDHSGRFLNRVQRFNQAVDFLNKNQYHANWEARPSGPQVTLRHCPFQDLAQTQPLLCQLDQELLRILFGLDLILFEKRSFGNNPYSPCLFRTIQRQRE